MLARFDQVLRQVLDDAVEVTRAADRLEDGVDALAAVCQIRTRQPREDH